MKKIDDWFFAGLVSGAIGGIGQGTNETLRLRKLLTARTPPMGALLLEAGNVYQ